MFITILRGDDTQEVRRVSVGSVLGGYRLISAAIEHKDLPRDDAEAEMFDAWMSDVVFTKLVPHDFGDQGKLRGF